MAFGRSFVRSGTYRVEPPSAAELDHLLRQRAKLKKDAFKDGVFDLVRDAGKSALRWVGMDPSFWVAQGVYTLLRVYARGKGATPFPTLTPLSAVGSLCAFIVVFYTSQAWSRRAREDRAAPFMGTAVDRGSELTNHTRKCTCVCMRVGCCSSCQRSSAYPPVCVSPPPSRGQVYDSVRAVHAAGGARV